MVGLAPDVVAQAAPTLNVTGVPANISEGDEFTLNISIARPGNTVSVEIEWHRNAFDRTGSVRDCTGLTDTSQRPKFDGYLVFDFCLPNDWSTARTVTFTVDESGTRSKTRKITIKAFEVYEANVTYDWTSEATGQSGTTTQSVLKNGPATIKTLNIPINLD